MSKWDEFDLPETDENDALDDGELNFGRKPARIPLAFAFIASLVGAYLAGTSTADFIAHLDRQGHAVEVRHADREAFVGHGLDDEGEDRAEQDHEREDGEDHVVGEERALAADG